MKEKETQEEEEEDDKNYEQIVYSTHSNQTCLNVNISSLHVSSCSVFYRIFLLFFRYSFGFRYCLFALQRTGYSRLIYSLSIHVFIHIVCACVRMKEE